MDKEEQKWDQELELEEEEEESLEVRRSTAPSEGTPFEKHTNTTTTLLNGSGSHTNGHMVLDESSQENSVLDELFQEKVGPENVVVVAPSDNNGVYKESEIQEGHPKSNNCVYHDKNEGIWKCQICSWTCGSSSLRIDLIQNPNGHLHDQMNYKTLNPRGPSFNFEIEHIKKNHGGDSLLFTAADVGAQKNLNSVTDHQHEIIQKNVNLSKPQHSEILPEESTSYNNSKITDIEPVDIDLVDESDNEGEDLDVESVLQKQKTHDLYCPNCNSCITRRVILRKRKRRVRLTSEDIKRNKLETITDSTAKGSYQQATSGQDHCTGEIHPEGISELVENDQELEKEPDIFRCLACFSIFIPTGKGYKLFQIFGDKSKKKTVEDLQISPSLVSDKDRIAAESGSDLRGDLQKTSSKQDMPSLNLSDPNRTADVQGVEEKDLPSSSQQQPIHEKAMPIVGNISNDAKTMKKDAGDDAKNTFSVSSDNQPSTSNVSNDTAYFQGDQLVAASTNRSPSTEGESKPDAISACQPDGLKLLVSQTPDLKVQNTSADIKSILSTPWKVSDHKEVDISGNTTAPVEIFHGQHVGAKVPDLFAYENATKDKLIDNDGPSSYQPPQLTIDENKLEIHAGEDLKIDTDALLSSVKEPNLIQDQQADNASDFRKVTISGSGQDTIIVVETGPNTSPSSQLVQSSNASAEIGTSPVSATDIDVVEQMGAEAGDTYEIEIIKSIVYGGLVESVTSLGVVSSAAGGGTATINILALAGANLIGGLVLVGHNLLELKKYHVVEVPHQVPKQIDRYKELLGRRENFIVHSIVTVLSFIIFGLISPITYAFSFQKSDDRDLKLLSTAAASLMCIVFLATGRAYVREPPKTYFKTVLYYVLMGFTVSGVSYAAGEVFKRLLEKFHVLQPNSSSNAFYPVNLTDVIPDDASLWASY